MIESKLFTNLQENFEKFKKRLKQDEEFEKRIIYYYELALENIKQNNQEIAILLLCTIIESLAYKKYKIDYRESFGWLMSEERLSKFSNELLNEENKKAVVKKWKEKYEEEFSITRKFVKIILDCYRAMGGVPEYIANWKTEKINGIKRSSFRSSEGRVEAKLYEDFEKDLKYIYREYRSKFVHQGNFIPFDSAINTEIGGISQPQRISSQQFAGIVLVVMKDFFSN